MAINQITSASFTPVVNGTGRRSSSPDSSGGGLLEAVAGLWAQVLDKGAHDLVAMGDGIGNGAGDQPGDLIKFQAHAQLFNIMANAGHTSVESIGQGEQTVSKRG